MHVRVHSYSGYNPGLTTSLVALSLIPPILPPLVVHGCGAGRAVPADIFDLPSDCMAPIVVWREKAEMDDMVAVEKWTS